MPTEETVQCLARGSHGDATPEYVIRCGDASDQGLGRDFQNLVIDGPHANIHFRLEEVRRGLWTRIPTILRDLMDLAIYVYTADQATLRAKGGRLIGPEIGAGWRRKFRFRVPVRCPEVWRRDDIRNLLLAALGFASEDDYEFEFVPIGRETPLEDRLDFSTTPFTGVVQEIMMFSGGLDSLAGAVSESIGQAKDVLLIHHRSTEKLANRHRRLLTKLDEHAWKHRPLHFPVRVNKDKYLGQESTQRTRSFLFTAFGATFARMTGLDRLRFYENGVISLNLPPSTQVIGARASRTTHPRTLAGFQNLLTALLEGPFTIENPFLWKTKTDIVRDIAEAKCGELIGLSTSCADVRQRTSRLTHCGVCSQCIDRRFAVLAAGQEANDPADAYEVDLLVGERPDGEPKAMIAAYLDLADRVEDMGITDFVSRFGEIARVVPCLGLPSEEAGRRVYDLYQRHSREVNRVVQAAIDRWWRPRRRQQLPPSCVLRIALDDPTPVPPEPSSEPPRPEPHYLIRRGRGWVVRYNGGEENILTPSRGAAYLRLLLAQPHKSISAVQLASLVAQRRVEYALGDAGTVSDEDALSAYQARCEELREVLEEAQENNDSATQARAEQELEALRKEIRKASGRNGSLRRVADDRERIRKAVGNAIRRVIREIGGDDPELATHLEKPCVTCGSNPCYRPAQGINWVT